MLFEIFFYSEYLSSSRVKWNRVYVDGERGTTTTASNRALICSASTRKILMKTSQLCFESVRDTEVFLEFEWYFFEVPPKLCQTATSLWNNCANTSSLEILRVSSPQISGGSSEKNLRRFHLLSHVLGEVSHSIILFFFLMMTLSMYYDDF